MDDDKIIIKTSKEPEWPTDEMFYMLTANGLFICRNHEWFTSSALAKTGPSQLEEHKPFLKFNYPKLSQARFEQVVGFFHAMADKFGEVAVLLVQNQLTKEVEILVPPQECSFTSVDYEIPMIADNYRLIGDIHSHVDFSAKPSWTDEKDEEHRPGLHIVVGKIKDTTPDFYTVIVVDGQRFTVSDINRVVEGFELRRDDFPKHWTKPLKKKHFASYIPFSGQYGRSYWMD